MGYKNVRLGELSRMVLGGTCAIEDFDTKTGLEAQICIGKGTFRASEQ